MITSSCIILGTSLRTRWSEVRILPGAPFFNDLKGLLQVCLPIDRGSSHRIGVARAISAGLKTADEWPRPLEKTPDQTRPARQVAS